MVDILPERKTTKKVTLTRDDQQVILPRNMQESLTSPVTEEQIRLRAQPTTGIRGDLTSDKGQKYVMPPIVRSRDEGTVLAAAKIPTDSGDVFQKFLDEGRNGTRKKEEPTITPKTFEQNEIENTLKSAGKGVLDSAEFILKIAPQLAYNLPDIASSVVGWSPYDAGMESFGSERSIVPALWKKFNDTETKRDKDAVDNLAREWNEDTWLKRYWLDPLTRHVFDPTSSYLSVPKSQKKPIYTAITLGTSVLAPFAGVASAVQKSIIGINNMKRGVEVYKSITQPISRTQDLFSADGKVIHSMTPKDLQFSSGQALKLAIMESMKFRAAPDKKFSEMTSVHELVESLDYVMDPRLERSLIFRGKINDVLNKNSGVSLEKRRKMQVAILNNAMMAGGATAGYAISANFTDNEIYRLLFSLAASVPVCLPRSKW